MVRTQIQLTEQQAEWIRNVARQEGVSMAELIRRGLDLYLRGAAAARPADRRARALAAAGRFRSGCRDVSQRHDAYLDGAFGS